MSARTPHPPHVAVMERKTKTLFQLETPFTIVQWPEIPPNHQDTILELLCSLLSPIGQHRSNHIVPSKGKRSKKRKRKQDVERSISTSSTAPLPEISSSLVLGLNSITRSLETLSQASASQETVGEDVLAIPMPIETKATGKEDAENPPLAARHFSVIFAVLPPKPTILHEHFPQLVVTASMAHPELPVTRLVQLPKSSSSRLSEALGLPRASFLGLQENAPHSKVLVDFIREHVPEIKIPWLQEAQKSVYLPLKINGIETFAPVVKGG